MGNPNTHNDTVAVTVTLATVTAANRGFDVVMLISSDSTLNSARTVAYASAAEVATALAAGYLSSAAAAAATLAFGQPRPPATFVVGRKASGETWADAYALCVVSYPGAYGICIQSRTDADILAVAAAIHTEGERLGFFQVNNSDLYSGALASSTLANLINAPKRCVAYYHSTDTEYLDVAHAVDRLAYSLDDLSPGWNSGVASVAANSVTLTQTQKVQLRDTNSVNVMLPFGTTTNRWVGKGVTIDGTPVEEVTTGDWFKARASERIADRQVALAAEGKKIPVSSVGQAIVLAELEGLLAQGVTAGHFVAGQTTVTAEAITSADTAANRLRFTGSAQVAVSARVFTFAFTVSESEVV
jgi:hypothetical protein